MQSRKPSRWRFLTALSALTLALGILTAILLQYGNDAYWPVMCDAVLPPIVFALFPLILLIASAASRNRRMAVVNLASLLLAAGPLMGFHWRFAAPPARGRSVRVMTWNVEKWSHGPDAVARGVRAAHPDVVCFQEAGDYFYVKGPQGAGLITALPEYHFVRAGEIIVASRWPIAKIAEAPLPPGPASRPALCTSVTIDGQKFTVISAHLIPSTLDQNLSGGLAGLMSYSSHYASERQSQGDALLRAMAAIPGSKILCGDFNAQPRSSICRRLTRVYPDAFETAGRGYGYTLTATLPVERADHILTSRDAPARDCWVPPIIASDHRAVVAEVTLPIPQSP